jgi:hypothetical protein
MILFLFIFKEFHMKNKTILDIRYYEDKNFQFDKPLHDIGARFARKLREFDFKTGEYDHIYINVVNSLPNGHVDFVIQRSDWFVQVDVGVSLDFNNLNADEKHLFIIEMTTNVLQVLCERDGLDFEVVKMVKEMMLRYKTELEIVHKVKETAKYKVVISYQIRPLNKASVSFIEYTDKTTGVNKKKVLTPLKTYQDILFLVSTINVSKEEVIIKPRTSTSAEASLRSYKLPIIIPISDLLTDKDMISFKVMIR